MRNAPSATPGQRDGRHPQLPRRPRVVVFAVVPVLIVGVALAALLAVVARDASSVANASAEANRAASVAADLEAVDQANAALQSAFERAAATPDLTTRITHFSTANATGIRGTGAFSTYVQRSLHLPGEPAARRAYETATDAWDQLGASLGAVIVQPQTPAATIASEMARLETLQEARQSRLDTLRDLYLDHAARQETRVARTQRRVANEARWAIGCVLAFGLALTFLVGRRASRRAKESGVVELERAAAERRTDFEARVQRSMALAIDEAAVVASIAHTIDVVGFRTAEFLAAASEGGHLDRKIVAASGEGCGVERTTDCPAIRLRQRLDFPNSDAIDACPYLRERRDRVHQCVCAPVTIGDQTQSVLRLEALTGEKLQTEDAEWIAILARNMGERVSALRAFANSQQQAATDALTGLANRRTLEQAAHARSSGSEFAVLFADIDHFKDLNDTFGHETGDECLRAFARVLSRATRPGDLCARYGGEEFVVLLPSANREDACDVAERVQLFLAKELQDAHLAPFTVSIGIASTADGTRVDDVIHEADRAMFEAKATGRNRIVVGMS